MVGEVILAILLLISLILLGVVLVYFKYFRTYTRERFAFRVFLLISSLVASLIALIFTGGKAVIQIVDFIAKLFGLKGMEYEPGFADKALAAILIVALMRLGVKLHRNWPGAISTREHEAALVGLKPGLISGAIAAVEDIKGKMPLLAFSPARREAQVIDMLLSPSETKAWHHWVARILQISSNQIHIDELKDWFSDRRLFVSSYGLRRSPMGVLCCDHVPSKVEIRGHIRFVSEQAGPVTKFIVAVDSDDGKRSIENVDDIEVEFRYKKELLDSLVDFSRCAEDIDFRYEVSEIAEGFSYKLPDVYVASAGYIRRQVEITTLPNVEDYIASWAVEKTLKHLALLGEYGQGKSVLALKLAHRLFRAGGRIPILITLGGRSPRTQTKLEILADWAATYDVNPKALLILHEAGRLVLIFDGFDEMDLVGDSSLRLDHFRTLWDFSRDRHSKILITGRPNFFFDSIERESSLNVRSESIEVPFTEPIYLEPFDLPKISEALRAFPKDIRSQIVSMVDKDLAVASFRDLVSRPSTLFLAANIWGELRSLENIRSAEVIGRFISHSYERQQRKGLKSFLTSLEREYFTIGIAVAAYHEARLSNHISKEGFQRAIVSLIDGFPNDLRRFEPATDQAKLPLRERLQDREMLIETVSTDVRSCGIIVTDLSQLDTFKFAHKSFFEFLLSLNSVYTSFLWPLSKDKILHHAVALNVGKEQPSSQVLLYALASSLLMRPMNREMAQFSGEILYRLLGANPQISLSELDSKLRDIGIPVKRWHLDCLMWRRRLRSNRGKADLNVLARVLSITLMRTRAPLSNLMMMATLFRIHGQGGEDFIKLHDELELDRSLRIRRHTEREASASMALQ